MEEKEIHDELTAIRGLMERSSKFISLSGLSGILAGVYALIGEAIGYTLIQKDNDHFNKLLTKYETAGSVKFYAFTYQSQLLIHQLCIIALTVLVVSVLTAIFLSNRQARRKNQSVWGPVSRSLLFHMAIPLITGGTLIFILLYIQRQYHINPYYEMIVPIMLIFYGLALVSASNFTFNMVKYLGLLEILLGLIAACLPGYGLLFWAFGFGVLHIIYGSMMYLKYDR